MAFAVIHFDPRSSLHIIKTASAQVPIRCKVLHAEINVTVHLIGMSFFDQLTHHFDYFRHMFRDARIQIHPPNIQAVHYVEVGPDVPVCQLMPGDPFLRGSVDNLVIDIREILDMLDRQSLPLKVSVNDIPYDEGAGITDVRMIVGSDTADIDFDLARLGRNKGFLFFGQCIIDFQVHNTPSCVKNRMSEKASRNP